jgi:hypothetical protein
MMKRALYLCIFALYCSVLAGRAEIVDRILAVVEIGGKTHIITMSDVRQEREIRARLGQPSPESDKEIVQILIDDRLIESETTDYPGVSVTEEEISNSLQGAIGRESAPTAALRNAVRTRILMEKVFDLKFRQSIRPTEEEIRKYYDEVFLPEARSRGLNSVRPLSDPEMLSAVTSNVVQEMMDHEVNVWLEAIRRRSTIEVFE